MRKSHIKAAVLSGRALTLRDWLAVFEGLGSAKAKGVRVSRSCWVILLGLRQVQNAVTSIYQSEEVLGYMVTRSRYASINAVLRKAGLPYRLSFCPPGRQASRRWDERRVRMYPCE